MCHLHVESKEQNTDRLTDTENRLMVDRREGGWGLGVKEVARLRSTSWWLQKGRGDVNYSIGNVSVIL